MRQGFGIALAVLALTCWATCGSAVAASSHDFSSTHRTLVSAYKTLKGVLGSWHRLEANLEKLNRKFAAECPKVGEGSPQNESEQRLAYEVAGALWAVGYDTDAKYVAKFTNEVSWLRWSNHSIVKRGLQYIEGLHEMVGLQVPDLCGDIRTWIASGYKTVPANTEQFDQHVEAIEVEIPSPGILLPYMRPSDRHLYSQVKKLITRFDELEFSTGQRYWDKLLETLGINE